MIQIINGFKINSDNPIDSRIIVADDATRLAIQYKYHGLRVWQTNTNTPYFWDGTAWKSELDLVVTGVDGDVSVGTVPVFTDSDPVKIGDSIISVTPDLVTIDGDLSFDSISSGSINASLINTGTMSVSRLQKGSDGQILQTVGTTVQWKNLSSLTIGNSTNSVNSNNLKIKTINASDTYQLVLRNVSSTISVGGNYIELYGHTNGLKFKNDGNNGLRILAHNGSSTNPPYSFDSSSNTGMYRPGNNEIGFSANGSTNLVIGNGFVTFGNNITTGEPRIRTGNNTSPTTPSYTWYGNDQTGIYRPVQDVIGFSIAGQQAVRITSSYINFGLSSTGTPIIKNNSGNNSTPSYTWYGDSDTGMYRIDPNIIGFSTNGVLRLKIENDGTTVNNNFYLPSPNGSTPAAGKILTAVDGVGKSEWSEPLHVAKVQLFNPSNTNTNSTSLTLLDDNLLTLSNRYIIDIVSKVTIERDTSMTQHDLSDNYLRLFVDGMEVDVNRFRLTMDDSGDDISFFANTMVCIHTIDNFTPNGQELKLQFTRGNNPFGIDIKDIKVKVLYIPIP